MFSNNDVIVLFRHGLHGNLANFKAFVMSYDFMLSLELWDNILIATAVQVRLTLCDIIVASCFHGNHYICQTRMCAS